MAIIISGGDNGPLVTQKKRKKKVAYSTPTPSPVALAANINNLNHAHFSLTGKYASPEKAKTLLQAVGNKPYGVEDWKDLLDPARLLTEVRDIPTVEEAQGKVKQRKYEAGKREAEAIPFEPSALPDEAVGQREFFGRVGKGGQQLEDEDDIDPILEAREAIATFPDTGAPHELTPAPAKELGKIEDTIDYLGMAQREGRDTDLTPAERGYHDAIMGNLSAFASDLAKSRAILGLPNNFDPEDPHSKGLIHDYRELIGYSQLPAILIGTPEERAQALKTITAVYQLEPGEDEQVIVDAVATLPETLIHMGTPTPAVLDLCYKSHMAGRPFGQSEVKGVWDYVYRYGRDKLPPEGEELAAASEKNIMTFFNDVANATGMGEEGFFTKIMDFADPMDGLHEHFKDEPGAAATAVGVLHWFTHATTHLDVNLLIDRPLTTFGYMAELAVGDYDVVDGELVHTHGEHGGSKFWKVFTAEGLQATWDASGGVSFLTESTTHILHNFGFEVTDHPWLNEALITAGYISEIFLGAGVDSFAVPAGVGALKAGYRGARAVAKPGRLTAARTALADQTGLIGQDIGLAKRIEELPDEQRVKAQEAVARIDELEGKQGFTGEEAYTPETDAGVYARIKELGGVKGSTSDFWDRGLSMNENQAMFRGLNRKNGVQMDKLAQIIESEFPDAGVTDSASLWEWMQRTRGQKGTKVGKLTKAEEKELGRLYDELDSVIEGERLADTSVVEEGVSGQQAIVTEGERITGDTQLGMGAIDQDVVAPAAKPKVTAEGAAPEPVVTPKPHVEHGVKVVETSVGKVDAALADNIESLNAAGYKTFGSHAGKVGHAKTALAREVAPYIEFKYAENAGKMRAILSAAKKTGLKAESSGKGAARTVILSGEKLDDLHDFTEALTGKAIEPPPPPAAVAAVPPAGQPRYPWPLWNHAEVIAYHIKPGMQPLIARLFHIEDVPEMLPFLDEMAGATTPEDVIAVVERMKKESLLPHAIDMTMPGIIDLARTTGYTDGLRAGPIRLASVPAGLEGMHHSAYHADQLVLNTGLAFKMGRKKMTAADRSTMMDFANRALHAPLNERQFIVTDFCRVVENNMRAEGTWAGYENMLNMVRGMRGKGLAKEFGRAYTKNQRIVPAGMTSRLHAEIQFWEKAILEAADDADVPAMQSRLRSAREHLDDYKEAADIINGKKTKFEGSHDLEWAKDRMDALGTRTPFLVGEHANTIRLPWDPRVMGWYQGGAPVRAAVWIDAHGFDALMRMWKMYVMGTLSFPLRVFGKDEGMRLFAEGILVDPRRYRNMRETLVDIMGGQRGGRWRKLSKEESNELNELIDLSKRADVEKPQKALEVGETPAEVMTAEQFDRMTELKGKAEGSLSPEMLQEVEGEGAVDWVQALSDNYELLVPNDPGYTVALSRNLRRMSEEPIVRAFVKTDLKNKEEIRQWVQAFLVSDTEEAAALRLLLAGDRVVTAKQATPKGLRALYRSEERTGEAANLRTTTDNWADICYSVSVDPRLRNAVKRPGSVPLSELRKVDKELLWPVPTRDDLLAPHGIAGIPWLRRVEGKWGRVDTGTYNPLRVWYEQVTSRYMEGLSNRLRRVLFADRYGGELRGLLDNGLELETAQRIAFERSMRYTNSTAFTRNPTILEDVLRNYVPFVNSYRQFWVYWGKVLARNPFAMTAAYQYNPAQDQFGQPFGQYTTFGLPTQTFWQETPGGLGGIMKSNVPNVTPWAAGLMSSAAERSGITLTGLPGFAEDANFNPFSSFKALAFGLHLENTPLVQEFVGDMEGYEKEHAYHLKEYAGGKGEPVPESGTVETDWPAFVDFFSAAGNLDRPEFIMQGLTRIFSPLGTTKLTPAREKEIMDGMRLVGDSDKVARYRATHPDFDIVQRFYEGTFRERNALAEKYPWVVDYSATTNKWAEGTYSFTPTDYYEARSSDGVQTLEDKDINKNIAVERLGYWGGYRAGDPRPFPSLPAYKEAAAAMEKQLRKGKEWAMAVARQEADGSVAQYDVLMDKWDKQQPDRKGDTLPGIFHIYAVREAKAKGMDWRDYERTLSPVSIGQTFDTIYRDDYLNSENGSRDVDVQRLTALVGSGLLTETHVHHLLRGSPYSEAFETEQKGLREEALAAVSSDAQEEFYDLDSRKLRKLGVQCGLKLDEAIATVSSYYYHTYKKVVDKYGSASSEGREARLAYNAFKDKTFAGVKGGEALSGGLAERIVHIPYFTHPNYASVAQGHHAEREQKLWNNYRREAMSLHPDPKALKEYHQHFTPYTEERYQEFMRVNHMLYAAAMARYYRLQMKESWSDYYEGPGNSVYSNMGQRQVAKLSALIRELIKDDKRRWGAADLNKDFPSFKSDIYNYFESPHNFAYTALEWYS